MSLAYNWTQHEVTKISPIEFTFGYKPNIPIATIKNELQEGEVAQDFNKNRQLFKERAKWELKLFKKTQGRLEKRKFSIPDYKVGNSVLVKWKQSRTSKLRCPWDGPYTITKIPNEQAVTIERGNKEVICIFWKWCVMSRGLRDAAAEPRIRYLRVFVS